jgi:biotin operon repressor
MQESTAQSLRAVAPAILEGTIKGNEPFTPKVVQRAIAILAVLSDGEWHTTVELSEKLGIGRKYAADILRTVQDDWGLASHRRNGWLLVQKDSVIIA